jgi:hypothetical protein
MTQATETHTTRTVIPSLPDFVRSSAITALFGDWRAEELMANDPSTDDADACDTYTCRAEAVLSAMAETPADADGDVLLKLRAFEYETVSGRSDVGMALFLSVIADLERLAQCGRAEANLG